MSFSGKNDKVVYILVSIKLHVGKYMDSDQYVCDVLDYSRGTWGNCDNDTRTNYSEYLDNVCNDLSNDDEQTQGNLL